MKKQSTTRFPNSKNQFFAVLALSLFSLNLSAATIYVKPTGNDANTGASWAQAFQTLQKALTVAAANDQIWVAAGTYLPTATNGGTTNRHKTFLINKNLKIYGGFAGTETLLTQRNWTTNVTILSGDLGTLGDFSDNAFHVVWIQNRPAAMQLDGFNIEKGNSDQSTSHPTNGGGIFNETTTNGASSSPTIANCIITGNYASNKGAGMYNQSVGGTTGTTNPTLTNCTFISNTAGNYGGGLFNNGTGGCTSSPNLTNCSFLGNKANAFSGGAVFNHGYQGTSSPKFTNCVFIGNTANTDGGAALNDGGGGTSNANYINCSFSGNSALGSGGAMYIIGAGGSPTLKNCIIWGNSSTIATSAANPGVTYSIVQGGWGGTGNLDLDPLFVSQPSVGLGTAGDLRLQTCSPAIDNGNDPDNTTTTDRDGNTRKFDAQTGGTKIDRGAYELQTLLFGGIVKFVNAASTNTVSNGLSWACAFKNLQDAIDAANPGEQIWVAAGTYLPTVTHGGTTDHHKTFYINKDVKIYGGFNGTETALAQRNWTTNVTTLSGDIGVQNWDSDNAIHVVWIDHRSTAMILDGFKIEHGLAVDGTGTESCGGGIFNDGSGSGGQSNPTIQNCTFFYNTAINGGGLMNNGDDNGTSSPVLTNCTFNNNFVWNNGTGAGICNRAINQGTSNPVFTNCVFTNNSATDYGGSGGGITNIAGNYGQSSPSLTNCTFTNNAAPTNGLGGAVYNIGYLGGIADPVFTNCLFKQNTATWGGAIFNYSTDPTMKNCIFWLNYAGLVGGALYNLEQCTPTLINCTLYANTAYSGGDASYNSGSGCNPYFQNCILWNNGSDIIHNNANAQPSVNYSIVQGGYAGPGNLDAFPVFLNAAGGNFHLHLSSPAVDAGIGTGAPTTDFDSNARVDAIAGGFITDMGAFELQSDLDIDNDGYTYWAGYDCNDNNANIHPGAEELCNAVDEDCDGSVTDVNVFHFSEDFDNVPGNTSGGPGTYAFPAGWTLVNVDNKTPKPLVSFVNDAWERMFDVFFNASDTAAFSTSYYNPAGQADDWMWTPLIGPLTNDSLFWNAVAFSSNFADGYEVRVMTAAAGPPSGGAGNLGNMVSGSTLVLNIAAEEGIWKSRSLSLANWTGQSVYIGFRNHSTDKYLLAIDDIKVVGESTACDLDGDGYTIAQGDCDNLNANIHPGATDICGNTVDEDCTGIVNDPLDATASVTNVSCNGGSNGAINITPTCGLAPYSYYWSNGATTEDLTNLEVGTYSVTITDSQDLQITLTATVTQPAVMNLSFTATQPTCAGGSNGKLKANPSGATGTFSYLWSNGATTREIINIPAGTYSVTVTANATGCTKTGTTTLAQPAPVTVSLAVTNPVCFGQTNGSIKATATGGTGAKTLLWNTGATTATISNLAAGTYTVTATDTKGCTGTASGIVVQPSQVVLSHTVELLANGKYKITLSASGGTPYTTGLSHRYCKLSAAGACAFNSTIAYTNLLAGTTHVFRARDSKLCSVEITVTLPAAAQNGSEDRTASDHPEKSMSVFPNPNAGEFQIEFDQPVESSEVFLHDLQGKLILKTAFERGSNLLLIRLENLPSGIYLLRAEADGAVFRERLVVN